MDKLLYVGSDIDISPIMLYPNINHFVYIDQTPRNYEAHWGIEYYKGLYIPSYRLDCGKKDMVESFITKMNKYFPNVKSVRDGDKLEISFGKKKRLTYWLNTILPEFTFKNQFVKIKESNKKNIYDPEFYLYFSKTNLTKEIIDDMLKCNILYIRGYHPSFPILQMLKLKKIITQDYILSYHHVSKKDSTMRGRQYGMIDLRKPFLNYQPPKEIEYRDDLYREEYL